jgi:quercetin dioxygenase-like cupin family protein
VALPQDISPVNSEIMDALVCTDQLEWIPQSFDPERQFVKVLWVGRESGRMAVLMRSLKGSVVPPHKHLGDAHVFMLKGRLKVRNAELTAGDYLYESNGMVHYETEALEDTEYLFIMSGAVLLFDNNTFLGYQSWEEFHRTRERHVAEKR